MAKFELSMPKMGESIIEATILSWTKEVGDLVELDETILEIATDKVDSEVPSPVEGKLVEQLYKEGDVVPVGAVIAIIEAQSEESETGGNGSTLVEEQAVVDVGVQKVLAEEAAIMEEVPYVPVANSVVETPVTNGVRENRFYSPLVLNIARKEGLSMQELENMPGTGRGGRVTKKDILSYLTQKKGTTVAPPAKEEVGVIGKVKEVAKPLVSEKLASPSVETQKSAEDSATDEIEAIVQKIISEPQQESVPEIMDNISKAPTTNSFTATPEIQSQEIKAEAKPIKPPVKVSEPVSVPKGNVEIVEMDRMRKLIAKNMLASTQTSAHVTSFVEADVTHIVKWRNQVKDEFQQQYGEKLTYTPIFVQAVIKALREMPLVNASVQGDNILIKKDINIGIAVALPTDNLIVPVIKHADRLNLAGLSAAVNDLATRARNNKLKPEDLEGGTYTISNVGTFGNVMGTPIIMQPQVAILATGAIRKLPAVLETPTGDVIAIRQKMFLSHSYDHRIIDGALGGRFIKRVADILESWDMDTKI